MQHRNARLHAAMAERNIRGDELADAIGVHRVTICNVRAGTNVPSLPTALKIANALSFTVEELFGHLTESGVAK